MSDIHKRHPSEAHLTLDEFEEKIEREVRERVAEEGRNLTFLPRAYKNRRRKGRLPKDIDYDMCHIWR